MQNLRRLSLRSRFLAFLLPVIVVAPLATGVVSHRLLEQRRDEEMRTYLSARLASVFQPLTATFAQLRGDLDRIAFHMGPDAPRPGDQVSPIWSRQWQRVSAKIFQEHPDVLEIFYVSPPGEDPLMIRTHRDETRSHALAPAQAPRWALEEATSAPVQPGTWSWGENGPVPALWTALPMQGGARVGVVVAATSITRQLSSLSARGQGYSLLVDARERVLLPESEDFGFDSALAGATVPCAPRLAARLAHRGTDVLCSDHGHEQVVSVERDATLGLTAALVVPRSALNADIIVLRRNFLILTSLSVLLATGIILVLVRWIVHPLGELSYTMSRVARGDLNLRVPVTGEDEVAQLSQAFNTMTEDLENKSLMLDSQRMRLASALQELKGVDRMKDSFLALVSHEVRTPLTSILSGIEFLNDMMDTSRSEDERTLMQIIHDSGERLSGFMNDAILMASLQSSYAKHDFDEVSMTSLLDTQLEALGATRQKLCLELTNHLAQEKEAVTWGDWTLLEVALQKVFHNACRHNHEGGRIDVELVDRIREDEGGAIANLPDLQESKLPQADMHWRAIRVFNTGPTIPPEKIQTLFGKFELVHDIANHQQGSGLSLSIVMIIMKHHGGTVEVRASADGGMVFYLVLPLRLAQRQRSTEPAVPEGVDEVVATALRAAPRQRQPVGVLNRKPV